MAVLFTHIEVVSEDQPVYPTGHRYVGFAFRHCTLVPRDGPGAAFEDCRFASCVRHVGLVVPNVEACRRLEHLVGWFVGPALIGRVPASRTRPEPPAPPSRAGSSAARTRPPAPPRGRSPRRPSPPS
jgi:hypothetical protein